MVPYYRLLFRAVKGSYSQTCDIPTTDLSMANLDLAQFGQARRALRFYRQSPATTLHGYFHNREKFTSGLCPRVAVAPYPFEAQNTTRPRIRSSGGLLGMPRRLGLSTRSRLRLELALTRQGSHSIPLPSSSRL